MEELREIFDSTITLITEKSALPTWAIGALSYDFAKAGKLNLNGRVYPEEILSREIKRKNEELKKQKISGQLDHPNSISTRLDKAMHILDSLNYDPATKKASAKSYILDTSGGNSFLTLLKSGLKLGASMRGSGTVTDGRIQDDYVLHTIDFVEKPSFGTDAQLSAANLIESANDLLTEKIPTPKRPEGSSEKFIQMIMESCYDRDALQGTFVGSFEDWKREKEPFYRATIAVQDGLYESVEQALEAAGHHSEARKVSTKMQRVTPMQVFTEAYIAGIDPQVYADRINKSIDESEELEATGYSDEEMQAVFENLRRAGVTLTTHEERKKALAADRQFAAHEEQTLEEEAQAFLQAYKAARPDSNATLEDAKKLILAQRKQKEEEELKDRKIRYLVKETMLAGAVIKKKGEQNER